MKPFSPHPGHHQTIRSVSGSRSLSIIPGQGLRPGRQRHFTRCCEYCSVGNVVASATIIPMYSASCRAGPGITAMAPSSVSQCVMSTTNVLGVRVRFLVFEGDMSSRLCSDLTCPLRRAPSVMVEYMTTADGASPAAGGYASFGYYGQETVEQLGCEHMPLPANLARTARARCTHDRPTTLRKPAEQTRLTRNDLVLGIGTCRTRSMHLEQQRKRRSEAADARGNGPRCPRDGRFRALARYKRRLNLRPCFLCADRSENDA